MERDTLQIELIQSAKEYYLRDGEVDSALLAEEHGHHMPALFGNDWISDSFDPRSDVAKFWHGAINTGIETVLESRFDAVIRKYDLPDADNLDLIDLTDNPAAKAELRSIYDEWNKAFNIPQAQESSS